MRKQVESEIHKTMLMGLLASKENGTELITVANDTKKHLESHIRMCITVGDKDQRHARIVGVTLALMDIDSIFEEAETKAETKEKV